MTRIINYDFPPLKLGSVRVSECSRGSNFQLFFQLQTVPFWYDFNE